MAQTNFTPISLYYSATAAAVPTAGNLVAGELAINTADGKLFYKDSAGVVQVIGTKGGVGSSTTTQVLYNSSGLVVGSANLTFNGTTLTAGGLTTTGATSTGTFSATGVATFSAGTVSAPAITTAGDTNTGIFFPAADTIAFAEGGVESMRINSSGNLGINSNNPTSKLEVIQTTVGATAVRFNGVASTYNFDFAGAGDSYFDQNNIYFRKFNATACGQLETGVNTALTLTSTSGIAALTLNTQSANTSFVVYQSAGVENAATTSSNSNLMFHTGSARAERMRILSGGSVCVNTTAAVVDSTSRLIVSTTTTNGVAGEFSNSTSGTCALAVNNSGAATSTLINWIAAGSYRAAVTWNGTNIIYGTPSDQRLKENIVDSTSALPLINNIKIRSFDFKENGKHIDFGVIAQELVSVVPESVLKGKDNEDGSIKESWSVDTSTLVPAMIKAIQELKAELDSVKAELQILKGN